MNEQSSIFKLGLNLKAVLLILMLFSYQMSEAQSQLELYIQEGLSRNESIKQHEFALHKSLSALREARTLFLPAVSFQADYFRAGGGRTIDIPVGDALNPVYTALNQITQSSGFPQIENESYLLNPDNFYDARFRTLMPLVNLEIEYNRRIMKGQMSIKQIEVALYKRELIKEIKTAYFLHQQSAQAVLIYQSALDLALENQRINKALFRNGMANRTSVIRGENEVIKYQSWVDVALIQEKSARAYFNFLLNRNMDEDILSDTDLQEPFIFPVIGDGVNHREELQQLSVAREINQHMIGLSRAGHYPRLNTFADVGSQGFGLTMDQKNLYYFVGISLQWDLFAWGRNHQKVQQARIEGEILESRYSQLQDQLRLQFLTATHAWQASVRQYQSARSQNESSLQYFNDIQKLYKEGQVLLIELLDAQNQYITSRLQTSISFYDTWIKAAEVERASPDYNLNY
jgi:outer membrane protein TolC